jgi:hydrogenase expression/formation protein HypE
MTEKKTITMAHGSGGRDSAMLMRDIFGRYFSNETLDRLEDAATLNLAPGADQMAVSTDSFVVSPIFFPGGDIGKLAVCGTVNDVLMMGAEPRYLTCGFILEDGLDLDALDRVARSMAETAAAAGVTLVAGDTKVIERRALSQEGADAAPGLMVNTTGIGFPRANRPLLSASAAHAGDAILVSGELGDHHACILSARMNLKNGIKSDCAVLTDIADALCGASSSIDLRLMRDVTRGGLATVLNEIASSSRVPLEIDEAALPVNDEVRAFCGIMGLDPIYMGNEGKLVAFVAAQDAEKALAALHATKHGAAARIIGRVADPDPDAPPVTLRTRIGGARRLDVLQGEGLPRIC